MGSAPQLEPLILNSPPFPAGGTRKPVQTLREAGAGATYAAVSGCRPPSGTSSGERTQAVLSLCSVPTLWDGRAKATPVPTPDGRGHPEASGLDIHPSSPHPRRPQASYSAPWGLSMFAWRGVAAGSSTSQWERGKAPQGHPKVSSQGEAPRGPSEPGSPSLCSMWSLHLAQRSQPALNGEAPFPDKHCVPEWECSRLRCSLESSLAPTTSRDLAS